MKKPELKNKSLSLLALLGLAAMVSACGGGGGGTPASSEPETGVFLDSPVINVGYRTETLNGSTNSSGEYTYLPGETVTFFIGDLEFPGVTAANVITPLELAGSDDVTNPVVVNIIRLLQTLDQDGNPDNGIQITDAAKAVATQVDFTLDEAAFAASEAVTTLISSAGQVSLVDTAQAIQHFQQTLNVLAAEDVTVTVNITTTITEYTQGALREADGATMQCDLYEDKQVGGTETHQEVWTRSGATITGYEEGYLEDTWTMPIDLSARTININETFTELNPTGQVDDIFESTYVSTGSLVWNADTQAFEGSIREVTTLSWSINSQTSVCDETFSVSVTITAGSASEFLGSN